MSPLRPSWIALATIACGVPDAPGVDTDQDVVVAVDTDDTDVAPDTDAPADTDVPPPPDHTVRTSGAIPCADPTQRDAARWAVQDAPFENLVEGQYRLVGGGAVVADLTGDGLLDVLLPGAFTSQYRVGFADGTFTDLVDEGFPGVDLSMSTGATAVDVDGDGDLDLFVTRWAEPSLLLLNSGRGVFADATTGSGIDVSTRAQTSAWGDMDRDGDLDLFVGSYGPTPENPHDTPLAEIGDPPRLFENLGGGMFLDRSELIPDDVKGGYTFMSSFQDLDGDQQPELLMINDYGWSRPSRLFWNTPTGLSLDVDNQSGFEIPFAGMGLGIGDLNGDERPDFVQTSWKAASLLLSTPVGWFEGASSRGLIATWEGEGDLQEFGWGTEVVDLDLDGDGDVLMNFGYWDEWHDASWEPDAVFVQDEAGQFHDEGVAWGMDVREPSRGLVVADFNNDGWPDVLKRPLDSPPLLYVSRCGEGTWLRVRTHAPPPNTFGISTRVRVTAGARVWNRWVHAGGTSMYSSGPPEVLFGLGGATRLDKVELFWPDGRTTTLTDVDADQILDVTLLPRP